MKCGLSDLCSVRKTALMGSPPSTARIIVFDIALFLVIVILLWASSSTQDHQNGLSSTQSFNRTAQAPSSEESKWPEIVTNLLIGLASAGAAVLGVILSNRHSRVIMKEQREEEFAAQERDRYLSYKKEVYFQVAEDLGRHHGLFSRLSDPEFDDKDFSSSASNSMSGLHKLNLLAGPDTLTASHSASVALIECVSDVFTLRLRIRILKSKIANAEKQIADLSKLIEEKLAEVKAVQEGEGRRALLPVVSQLIEDQKAIIDDVSQLQDERQGYIWELSAKCMEHGAKLQGFINSLVIAMRLEIGVPVDRQRYIAESKEAGDAVLRIQTELAEKVQAVVKEMIQRPY